MNKFAVYQARDRLKLARHELEILRNVKTWDDAKRHWYYFLNAANGVFVKLEKGAQNYPKTRGWWDRLKHRRKKDELLSYIHHARRVEEHGLEFSTGLGQPTLEPVPSDYVVPPEERGKWVVIRGQGELTFRVSVPVMTLKDVVDDQYGDVYPLPKSHNGQPLSVGSAQELAEIALNTIEKIIEDAARLVPPDKHRSSHDRQTQGRG